MVDAIILFPGQGSQKPGMGKDFYEEFSVARDVFAEANAALGFSISEKCFTGSEEELKLTPIAQPAVAVMDLAVMAVLREKGIKPLAVAGHSLGEYAALCSAGVFRVAQAAKLTRRRGELMQQCADSNQGSMVAVIGAEINWIEESCRQASAQSGKSVTIANYNSPRQVVITGESEAVSMAADFLREKGAKRTVELKVSGPWHSSLLTDAQTRFASVLAGESFSNPQLPVFANVDAARKNTGEEVKDALLRQITSPVRWTQLVRSLLADFPGKPFIECGPGKVLKGLLRDISRETICLNVESISSLQVSLDKLNA